MSKSLACVTLVVRDYEEAITYFTKLLGFDLLEDTRLSNRKRWVVVGPARDTGTRLSLAKAADKEQEVAIGRQAGGRVAFFLETDDFSRDFDTMKARGVKFLETPRREPYGTVAKFQDLYGNYWDLIQSQNVTPT